MAVFSLATMDTNGTFQSEANASLGVCVSVYVSAMGRSQRNPDEDDYDTVGESGKKIDSTSYNHSGGGGVHKANGSGGTTASSGNGFLSGSSGVAASSRITGSSGNSAGSSRVGYSGASGSSAASRIPVTITGGGNSRAPNLAGSVPVQNNPPTGQYSKCPKIAAIKGANNGNISRNSGGVNSRNISTNSRNTGRNPSGSSRSNNSNSSGRSGKTMLTRELRKFDTHNAAALSQLGSQLFHFPREMDTIPSQRGFSSNSQAGSGASSGIPSSKLQSSNSSGASGSGASSSAASNATSSGKHRKRNLENSLSSLVRTSKTSNRNQTNQQPATSRQTILSNALKKLAARPQPKQQQIAKIPKVTKAVTVKKMMVQKMKKTNPIEESSFSADLEAQDEENEENLPQHEP